MDLFIRKPVSQLLHEASEEQGKDGLRRVLGPWGLIALGIGVIIGAGLFSITGMVTAEHTGPAIILSFIIASIVCALAGLCYAEFASMLPIAGSAYTYSYATMGELLAWIIGWDLVLEYAVAATTVSISWSRYFCNFLHGAGIQLPAEFTMCPSEGGIANIPAALIVVVLSLFLMRGTKESATLNALLVALKLAIVGAFIVLGWQYINADNYTPFIPENTGTFGQYGWSGVLRGAAIVFFAYIGFDAVSTAAQEARNPKRNMPIGILGSLFIVTILYILFTFVMTGVANYETFKGKDSIAPVLTAISQMGEMGANGVIQPAYPWLNGAIVIAILVGYTSVILVMLMGQSRVFYSMSKDGLLPPLFSKLHSKFRTPARSNMLFMLLIAMLAAFVPANVAGEMTSIGTLFAFTLVCAGVIVVRRTMPDIPRGFRVPLVPYIPALGIIACVTMMIFLPADTWIRLVMWMLIGMDIYCIYGIKHSNIGRGVHTHNLPPSLHNLQSVGHVWLLGVPPSDLRFHPDGSCPCGEHSTRDRHGQTMLSFICIGLTVLCVLTAFWHQNVAGWGSSKVLFWITIAFAIIHAIYYTLRLIRYRRGN